MTVPSKDQILVQLKDDLPILPRGLLRVAKYIIDHPGDIGLDPIRMTAKKAAVSTNTLVRMAEHLGFDSYDAMRAPFRKALVSAATSRDQPVWVSEMREHRPFGPDLAQAATNGLSIVDQTYARQNYRQLDRVAHTLLGAPRVFLTGMRASYSLAYYLHYVGRMALPHMQLIPRHMGNAIDELEAAQPGDVMIAITFTPYSRETIEACAFARRKGVTLILISDSDILSPDFSADETLIAAATSSYPFGCYTGAMCLIEMLIATLVAKGGDPVKRRIAKYEALRRDNQAYWGAQRNR